MVYIGSTTQSLAKRIGGHKVNYKAYSVNGKRYISSYEIIKYPDAYVELIEVFPCNNKMELCKREGQIIRTTENTTNRRIEGRTIQEYRSDNVVKIKQYRIDNADTMKDYNKQYRTDNADILKEQAQQYYQDNKDILKYKKKQYRTENATTIKEQSKQYRADNADTINKKHICQCGSSYTKRNRSRHLKSLKHQEYQTIIEFILS
jgi:hypothetical protein